MAKEQTVEREKSEKILKQIREGTLVCSPRTSIPVIIGNLMGVIKLLDERITELEENSYSCEGTELPQHAVNNITRSIARKINEGDK